MNLFSTKTPGENLLFPDGFREYRSRTLVENGLSMLGKLAKLSEILGATKSSTEITRYNNE